MSSAVTSRAFRPRMWVRIFLSRLVRLAVEVRAEVTVAGGGVGPSRCQTMIMMERATAHPGRWPCRGGCRSGRTARRGRCRCPAAPMAACPAAAPGVGVAFLGLALAVLGCRTGRRTGSQPHPGDQVRRGSGTPTCSGPISAMITMASPQAHAGNLGEAVRRRPAPASPGRCRGRVRFPRWRPTPHDSFATWASASPIAPASIWADPAGPGTPTCSAAPGRSPPVWESNMPSSASARASFLAPQRPLGQVGERARVAFPGDQRGHHRHRRLGLQPPSDSHRGDLDHGVFVR